MMKSALALSLLALVLFAASPATAGSAAGVNMPDNLTMYGKELRLNGMGVRKATVLRVKVYVAGLYVETPSTNPRELINSEQVKVLHMMFVRDVDKSDVAESLEKGFRGSADDYAQVRAQVEEMKSWMPSFDKGDTLTYAYRPGRGVRVAVNNKTVGTARGRAFARALFGVWFGDSPPDAGVKRGLLGR